MVNPIRHQTIFSPAEFGDRRVDVIGVGATGSRIALGLAKLGVRNLHIWDPDTVEEHNLANQAYQLEHVGERKVAALAALIHSATGITVAQHPVLVDGSERFGEVVFLLTDSMSSRKAIWEKGLRYKLNISCVIETRMGVETGRVYTVNPVARAHVAGWEATLCEDQEAAVSSCGGTISVGATAEIISGLATWQFIRWFASHTGKGEPPEQELMVSLRPPSLLTRQFD